MTQEAIQRRHKEKEAKLAASGATASGSAASKRKSTDQPGSPSKRLKPKPKGVMDPVPPGFESDSEEEDSQFRFVRMPSTHIDC